jgi:nucleoside 2-deoxyribosyltransferase
MVILIECNINGILLKLGVGIMKKLQIFISSTFIDLQEERQAAVEAVLAAGHIPAGMELFKPGNDSQLDTIKRWIDESDVYMLILGGRYGSIETTSGKSYTHLEYDYAISKGIPVFAVVLDKEAITNKTRELGPDAVETVNGTKYEEFKNSVLSRISRFVRDDKDIKLALLETIADFQQRYEFTGWVSGKDVPDTHQLYKDLSKLTAENEKLTQALQKISSSQEISVNGLSFQQISEAMAKKIITIDAKLLEINKDKQMNLLEIFNKYGKLFANGVHNATNATASEKFFFYQVAPELIIFGLMEEKKLTGKHYQRRQTSKEGNKFLAHLQANSDLLLQV